MADFMQGLMGMFTPGAEGIGGLLSEEERKKIANQALMTTAMKLLASGGRSAQPISLGQALGGAYLTGQEAMNTGVTNAAQNLLLRQKLDEAKTSTERRKRATEIMAQQMPAQSLPATITGQQAIQAPGALGPTVAKAALIGQQATPQQPQMTEAEFRARKYEQLAELYSDDPDKSEAYTKVAERYRPQEEWSTTPQTGIVNGHPVQYVMSKRGGMKVLDVKPSPNEDKIDTGSEIIIRNKDNNEIISRVPKTMTPGEVASNLISQGQLQVSRGQLGVAQGNLGVSQQRLELDRRAAMQPQFVDGQFVYKPTMQAPQGLAVPVQGFTGKTPEAYNKAMTGVAELQGGLDNLKTLVEQYGTSPFSVLPRETKMRLASAHVNLLMGAKNAFELGVLNGPDLDLIQRTIPDPNFFRGTNEAYMAALDEAQKYLDNKTKALAVGYGKNTPAPVGMGQNQPIPGINLDLINSEIERRKKQPR